MDYQESVAQEESTKIQQLEVDLELERWEDMETTSLEDTVV